MPGPILNEKQDSFGIGGGKGCMLEHASWERRRQRDGIGFGIGKRIVCMLEHASREQCQKTDGTVWGFEEGRDACSRRNARASITEAMQREGRDASRSMHHCGNE
jgi:hypothetical protein